jgi:hypothetical protein
MPFLFNPYKKPKKKPTPEDFIENTLHMDGKNYFMSITGVRIEENYKKVLEKLFIDMTNPNDINYMKANGLSFTHKDKHSPDPKYSYLPLADYLLGVYKGTEELNETDLIERIAYVLYNINATALYDTYKIKIISRR